MNDLLPTARRQLDYFILFSGIIMKKLEEIVTKCTKMPNLEFKLVLEELENIASTLDRLEKEVFIYFL